jgi:tripartite-type tricarboxylate transporter receptor subunit TctC
MIPNSSKTRQGDKKMQTNWTRRKLLTHTLAGSAVLAVQPGIAQPAYPTRPIRLLVGYPPGGVADILYRAFAAEVGTTLGQPVVVENKSGAAGVPAYVALKSAPPDGYTIGGTNIALWRQPILEDIPYDPLKDFTYIINIAEIVFAVIVSAASPFKTWADLLAYGRAHPEKVNFGASPGLRQTSHLFMLDVMKQENVEWQAVGYNGGPGGLNDLLGGNLTFTLEPVSSAAALARAGKVRLLALASAHRMKAWPEVPTMKELGYNLIVDSPSGVGGPAGLPPHIVKTLHDAFKAAMSSPSVLETVERTDQSLRYMSSEELTRYVAQSSKDMRAQLTRYGFAKKRG